MIINLHRVKNLSFILIDEFFSPEELIEVSQEIVDLKRFSLGGDKTKTALGADGELKKTGTGLFLDDLYVKNRDASAILQASRKLFSKEVTSNCEELDAMFGFIRESNSDCTLLNYYKEGHEYKPHRDTSRISAVTFIREGSFTGGEFYLPEQDIVIEAVNNRTVIFPSCVLHGAHPVRGDGTRISIAQFINRTGP